MIFYKTKTKAMFCLFITYFNIFPPYLQTKNSLPQRTKSSFIA